MPGYERTLQIGSYETVNVPSLGQITYDQMNRRYRYVKFLDAVTYVRGHVVSPASLTTYAVTNDVSGGSSLGLRFAGVLPYYKEDGTTAADVPTQNQGGWVMVTGYHTNVFNDGTDYAAGDTCAMVATDGATVPIAAATTTGTLLYVGWCPAIITATSGGIFVNCPLW